MEFVKQPYEIGWMALVGPRLAWYYSRDGVLLYTRVPRRAEGRGAWMEISTDIISRDTSGD